MKYDPTQLRSDLSSAFQCSELTYTEEFQEKFYNNACEALNQVYAGYMDDYMPEKLSGMQQLNELFRELKHESRQLYLKSLTKEDLAVYVQEAAMNAYTSQMLKPSLIAAFVQERSPVWVEIFLQKASQPLLELDQVFEELALLISVEFAQSIAIIVDRDIYTNFYSALITNLNALKEQMLVEIDSDGIQEKVSSHAPDAYRNRPLPIHSLIDERHPLNVLRYVHNQMFVMLPENITDEDKTKILSGLMPRLQQHHNYLMAHTADTDALEVIVAMRSTFILRAKLSTYLEGISRTVAYNILNAWLGEHNYQTLANVILGYDNFAAIRRGTAQVHDILMQEVDNFVALPDMFRPSPTEQQNRTRSPSLYA